MFTPSPKRARLPLAELQVEIPPKRKYSYYLDGKARQLNLSPNQLKRRQQIITSTMEKSRSYISSPVPKLAEFSPGEHIIE